MNEMFKPAVEIMQVIRGPFDDEYGRIWNLCLAREYSTGNQFEEEYFYSSMKDAMDDVERLYRTGPFVIDEMGNTEQDHTEKKIRKVLEDV
jgi:hypothetical protein